MLEIKFKKNIEAENFLVMSTKLGLIQRDMFRMLKNLSENGYVDINFDLKEERKILEENYDDARLILNFLNEKCGTKFRPGMEHLTKIKERIKEASVDDCKIVIAKKSKQWINNEQMKVFLRPATLFCKTNFHNYLGEKVL